MNYALKAVVLGFKEAKVKQFEILYAGDDRAEARRTAEGAGEKGFEVAQVLGTVRGKRIFFEQKPEIEPKAATKQPARKQSAKKKNAV